MQYRKVFRSYRVFPLRLSFKSIFRALHNKGDICQRRSLCGYLLCLFVHTYMFFVFYRRGSCFEKKKKNKNISSILINWFFPPLTFSSFIMLHMYVVLSSQIMTCDCVYNFTLNCFDIHVHYMYFITMLCLTCII